MDASLDLPAQVVALLTDHADTGLRFGELLGFAEVLTGETPARIASTLNAAVNAGAATFRFEPLAGDRSGLVFGPSTPASSALPPAMAPQAREVLAALQVVLKDLSARTDNRGDNDWIAEVRQLFERHGPTSGTELLGCAIQEGIRRKLLFFVSRETNHYLTLTLASLAKYTVFGLDVQSKQALCFHAFAGNPDIAVQLAKAWFTKSPPVLHGFTVGHAKPEGIPGQKPFQIIEL